MANIIVTSKNTDIDMANIIVTSKKYRYYR